MNRDVAERIVNQLLSLNNQLNELTINSDLIIDIEEKRTFLKHIGSLMGIVNIDLLMSIVKQYPDLDPDKEYFEEEARKRGLQKDM